MRIMRYEMLIFSIPTPASLSCSLTMQEAIKDTLHKNIGHLTEERTRIRRVMGCSWGNVSFCNFSSFQFGFQFLPQFKLKWLGITAQDFPDRPQSAHLYWHRLPRCSWSEQGRELLKDTSPPLPTPSSSHQILLRSS